VIKRDWQADWELCEKATSGPWWVDDKTIWRKGVSIAHALAYGSRCTQDDLVFIAAAREALPYWLQRARELEIENRRLKAVAEDEGEKMTTCPVYQNRINKEEVARIGDLWSGNWLWLWRMDAIDNLGTKIAEAKEGGITGVIVKAHDGPIGGRWMTQLSTMVDALQSAGLKVAAWGYLYGRDPVGEAARAAEALHAGASFYVADAESEFEKRGMDEAAAWFFFHLYQQVPEAVVGFTSFAVTNLHPKFPWSTFANHCRFAMPQVYWREIGWKPDICWSRSHVSYLGLGRPIMPVLQAFGGVDPGEMLEVADLAKRYGCPGVGQEVRLSRCFLVVLAARHPRAAGGDKESGEVVRSGQGLCWKVGREGDREGERTRHYVRLRGWNIQAHAGADAGRGGGSGSEHVGRRKQADRLVHEGTGTPYR